MWMQISLRGFCALGALANPRLHTQVERNRRGEYLQTTYWYER